MKNTPLPEPLRLFQQKTIYELADLYPDSKAFAFTVGKRKTDLYMVTEGINFPDNTEEIMATRVCRSRLICLKADLETGILLTTELGVKINTDIQAITISEFVQKTTEVYLNLLKLRYEAEEEKDKELLTRKIDRFKAYGIIRD